MSFLDSLFDPSLRGLTQGLGLFIIVLMVVAAIVVLRKLFTWRHGEQSAGGGGGCGVVVLVVIAIIGLFAWWIRGSDDAAPARELAAAKEQSHAAKRRTSKAEAKKPEPVASPEDRAEADQAIALEAEQLVSARRVSLEQRWRSARSIAVEKWRADLLTANALGEIGAAPPMLRVRIEGSQVRVTNRGASPACVQLARVTRPKTDAVQRCQVGPLTCLTVKPGATLSLPLFRAGAKDSCLNAALEFRVGNVDFPEPTWWSRTAFNEFADPPMDIGYKDEADLQADIARFEATVEDQDRAARWRRELMPAP